VDRRIRKTRALLVQGLIHLLQQKDIKDISVKELTDMVDINRGTFYLHYSDIYDMINTIEDDMFREFSDILDKDLNNTLDNTSYSAVLLDLFLFLDHNREITRVLIGPHGDLTFVNKLKDLIKTRLISIMSMYRDDPNFEINFAFVVSGYTGVFESWLLSDHPQSPEYMAEICSKMIQVNPVAPIPHSIIV